MHRISIFVQALTPKLNLSPLPALAAEADSWAWPRPLINEHAIVGTLGCHTPAWSPSSLLCQKWTPTRWEPRFLSLSMQPGQELAHAPGPNHGILTAKPSSHHVHVTLRVTSPTFLCPTFSADTVPVHCRAETIFSALCAVWCDQKCTIGFKSFSKEKNSVPPH